MSSTSDQVSPVIRKLLIIDDSELDRGILTQVMEKKGYAVVGIDSGNECLEVIAREKPNLVLLDVMMPGLPGNEVLKKIREVHTAVQLPVIMITAKSDTDDIVGSLELGANDYITKPVNFEVAMRRVSTQLEMARLSQEMSTLKEIEAIHSMISTYNHEINNPLTIAIGSLKALGNKFPDTKDFIRLEKALWRIADIVKKIEEEVKKERIEFRDYEHTTRLLKID